MKTLLLLTVALLGLIACSQAWWKKPKTTPRPSLAKSSCVYYRSSLRLVCRSTSGGASSCRTQRPKESSDKKPGGPPPRGLYLIGVMYRHSGHGIDWYNLYPQKRDGSGYYDYYYKNPETKRGHIALHPGTVTLGCVTVLSRPCWNYIRSRVNTGRASSIRVSTSWFRTKTIRYVGRLRVV